MRKHYISTAAAVAMLAGAARADDSASLNGITFYGIVDVDISYDTHGQPNSSVGSTSSDYLVWWPRAATRRSSPWRRVA